MKALEYPRGATPIDPEELEGLRLSHVTTREELNRWEHENISEAMRWLERRRQKAEILNEEFVRALHKRMLGKVWRWAGQFRRTNKNIGVHWAQIPLELKPLLDDTKYWIEHETYSPDEIAARFHHRMVLIHPFPNGNGRHARLIADVLLVDVLRREPFTWGKTDLNTAGNVRDAYIAALRAADNHDYNPLLDFVRL